MKCIAKLMQGIYICMYFFACNPSTDSSSWHSVIGYTSGGNRNCKINYTIAEVNYSTRFYRPPYGRTELEFYLLKYNPEDPGQVDIVYACPVFLTQEKTAITKGRIDEIFKIFVGSVKSIRYSYTVDGVTYQREQELPLDFEIKYPDLKTGKTCNVSYLTNNPKRAILNLECLK